MENIVFIVFLLFVLIAMLVLAFAIWVAATEIFSDNFGDTDANELKENKEGSEVRFPYPYTNIIGLTEDEYRNREHLLCFDEVRKIELITRKCYNKNIIVGVRFHVGYSTEFDYNYKKYYDALEKFAKDRKVRVGSRVKDYGYDNGLYISYTVDNFNPSEEECGLFKMNNHARFEEFCDSKLQKQLNDISFLNDVERFNNKKS